MRRLSAFGIVFISLLLLAGAVAIPFFFESPSMWYKFGVEKASLRAGKMLGMAAGLLLLFQLPLAGRLKALDRIFSLPGLMRQHRIHAWTIVVVAVMHPFCVLLSEGTVLVPMELRYWPEWVGVGLLVCILTQFICSRWRRRWGLAFHTWLPSHRITGLLIAILLVVHVLYVSESFTDEGPPRLAVFIAAGVFSMIWLWVRTGWLRVRRRPYAVSQIETPGADCTCVELTPATQTPFAYAPGQFAFVSFRSAHVSPEPHVFTLSSTPSRPGLLQFTIRACGDWTREVKHIQPGDRAFIQGPFGRFGHLYTAPHRELIMIAGGIGITPMLSMLRFMADGSDPRPVTLIWSNRSPDHVVFSDELDLLAVKLTGLRRIPIFTRNLENGKPAGRLNRQRLETMLEGCNRRSAIFLCGPPQMMNQVRSDLKTLGFPARSIFSEAFGF
jgi:predicted ferric reductase